MPARTRNAQCSGAQKPWVVADLLFGRAHMSEASCARFLAAEVTPRFPDGFTASSQGPVARSRRTKEFPASAARC